MRQGGGGLGSRGAVCLLNRVGREGLAQHPDLRELRREPCADPGKVLGQSLLQHHQFPLQAWEESEALSGLGLVVL